MDFSFSSALELLGPNAAFSVMNARRPDSDYVFSQILPEIPDIEYDANSGSMTIRATMAGMVGMDSPYPEGGAIDTRTFQERTIKMAQAVDFTEEAIRKLQHFVNRLQLSGSNVPEALANEVLRFTDTLLVQPHMDATEWLRGQALATGAIDWTFNSKRVLVDYGIPAGNKLTSRTGTAGYGGSASEFWNDMRAARKLLRQNVRAFIAHPDMIDAIIYNNANAINVLAQDNNQVRIQRRVGTTEQASADARDTITLISYGLEGEVLDVANPGQTIKKPFMPNTKIVAVANPTGTTYRVGAGSVAPTDFQLGYTHIAPTVEGGGAPGRWARVIVPENRPWALRGEAVGNVMPVIEDPSKIVIMTSVLP